jgi:hypothetical protein
MHELSLSVPILVVTHDHSNMETADGKLKLYKNVMKEFYSQKSKR